MILIAHQKQEKLIPYQLTKELYTLHWVKSRDKMQLQNFFSNIIKITIGALNKMKRSRGHPIFSWQHSLMNGTGNKMTFSNLRSWSIHIEEFITDEIPECCGLCLTGTNTCSNLYSYSEISKYLNGLKDIHLCTHHGLAFCYKGHFVEVVKEIVCPTTIEVLTLILDIEGEHVLLLLVHR